MVAGLTAYDKSSASFCEFGMNVETETPNVTAVVTAAEVQQDRGRATAEELDRVNELSHR